MFPLFAQPSLGDIDQDGVPDIVASGGSLDARDRLQSRAAARRPGEHLLAMWSGKTGAMLPGSPIVLEDFTFFNSQAIADLDGDDYPEVITGSGGYFLHAFDGCGREPEGWPKFTGQWIIPTAAVGDLDGDDKLEVVVGTRDGWLYAGTPRRARTASSSGRASTTTTATPATSRSRSIRACSTRPKRRSRSRRAPCPECPRRSRAAAAATAGSLPAIAKITRPPASSWASRSCSPDDARFAA